MPIFQNPGDQHAEREHKSDAAAQECRQRSEADIFVCGSPPNRPETSVEAVLTEGTESTGQDQHGVAEARSQYKKEKVRLGRPKAGVLQPVCGSEPGSIRESLLWAQLPRHVRLSRPVPFGSSILRCFDVTVVTFSSSSGCRLKSAGIHHSRRAKAGVGAFLLGGLGDLCLRSVFERPLRKGRAIVA